MRQRLTNEYIDKCLLPLFIKRIDDYIIGKIPIRFQHIIDGCNCIWKTTVNHIIDNGRRCPQCNGNIKLTKDIINNKRLIGRNILMIGDYKNIDTKTDFLCTKCNFIWNTKPDHVLNSKSGCPICNKSRLSERIIYDILCKYNIQFKYNYKIKNIDGYELHRYFVDFYLPEYNIIIEYNGPQHYEPSTFFNKNITKPQAVIAFEKQVFRDQYIEKFSINNNIKIIWIDGRIYHHKKLEQYMTLILDNIIKG